MKEIVWDKRRVTDFIRTSPNRHEFVRVKEPRGWKAVLKKHFKTRLYGFCFRNSLFASLHSNDSLYYCEGFVIAESGYPIPHAWLAPAGNLPTTFKWCYDLTWPWTYKGDLMENDYYIGIQLRATKVFEFIEYLRHSGIEEPTYSVFKYLDHWIAFNREMH